MYLTVATYVSDGVQRDFAVPFPYMNKDYVKAYSQEPNDAGHFEDTLVPLSFTWSNDALIRLDAVVPSGRRITIRRETYADQPLVDFQDAAILIEEDLDVASLQALHVAQEARDTNSLGLTDTSAKVAAAIEDILNSVDEAQSAAEYARAAAEAAQNAAEEAIEIADPEGMLLVIDEKIAALGEQIATELEDLEDADDAIRTEIEDLENSLDAYALLESPEFLGTPTAPTAEAGTNTKQIATTEFVQGEILSLEPGEPYRHVAETSQTLTAQKSGWIDVTLIGGGGAGGSTRRRGGKKGGDTQLIHNEVVYTARGGSGGGGAGRTGLTNTYGGSGGGSAGEAIHLTLYVEQGDEIHLVVGAGGSVSTVDHALPEGEFAGSNGAHIYAGARGAAGACHGAPASHSAVAISGDGGEGGTNGTLYGNGGGGAGGNVSGTDSSNTYIAGQGGRCLGASHTTAFDGNPGHPSVPAAATNGGPGQDGAIIIESQSTGIF